VGRIADEEDDGMLRSQPQVGNFRGVLLLSKCMPAMFQEISPAVPRDPVQSLTCESPLKVQMVSCWVGSPEGPLQKYS